MILMEANKKYKLKVLLIDVSDIEYFRSLSKALKKQCDVDIVSKYYSSERDAKHFFYKFSEKMHGGKFRNILRGIEYIIGWLRTYVYICMMLYIFSGQ